MAADSRRYEEHMELWFEGRSSVFVIFGMNNGADHAFYRLNVKKWCVIMML